MIARDDLNALRAASKEEPVFVRADIYPYPFDDEDSYAVPYRMGAVCAVTSVFDGEYNGDTMVQLAVLVPGEEVSDSIYRTLRVGDWLVKDVAALDVHPLEATEELKGLYAKFEEMHESAPYKVTGSLFSEEQRFYSWDKDERFPAYDELKGTEKTWNVPKGTKLASGGEVRSLEDVERWVLENHPAYLMGMSVMQDVPSGDFMILPNPGPEYPVGFYESFDARLGYAKQRAERLGVEVGAETARDVLAQRSEARPLPDGPDVSDGAEDDREYD